MIKSSHTGLSLVPTVFKIGDKQNLLFCKIYVKLRMIANLNVKMTKNEDSALAHQLILRDLNS
jgi:hypothetical protein